MIINAHILRLFNWAIIAQTGDYASEVIAQNEDITPKSTLSVLRNEEFLFEISSVQQREHIDEIADGVLLGGIQVYLRVYYDADAKLALEELESMMAE